MLVVGLTGSISCGKSTVSRLALAERSDVVVLDLDRLARRLQEPGSVVYHKIVHRFPQVVSEPGGPLDRTLLARLVFGDAENRRWIGKLMHWRIFVQLCKTLLLHWFWRTKIVLLDAPLLFESGLNRICAVTVAVHLDAETQIQRLTERDGIDREHALEKIEAQMPSEEKSRRADITIDNTGSVEDTALKVRDVLAQVRRRRPAWYMDSAKVLAALVGLGVIGRICLLSYFY